MTLSEWLASRNKTIADFAREIGRHRRTVHRHANGLRHPTQEWMQLYCRATDGLVTPNDFYGLGASQEPSASTGPDEARPQAAGAGTPAASPQPATLEA